MSSDADITPRPSDAYWANVKPEELGAQVRGRYLEYLRECEMRGHIGLWRRTAQTYYGYDPATGSLSDWITSGGAEGQFVKLHVNEFASLVQHQLILATAERLDFDCIPTSDAPMAEAQASLGKQVIRYYQGDGKLDASLVQGAERMLIFGASYITQLWDVFAGPEVGVEDVQVYDDSGNPVTQKVEVPVEQPMMELDAAEPPSGLQEPPAAPATETVEQPVTQERIRRGGDIVHRVYSPIDVARDIGARTHADAKWYVIRERIDRFELAARYPEKRQQILERPAYDRDETARYERNSVTRETITRSDQIHIYRLLHERTETVPQGMEALVCGDVVLQPPSGLAYARLPVHVMCASELLDTPMGHTSNADLLGPQAALNSAAIAGLTASESSALSTYAIPRGSNVDANEINKGALYYTPNPQMPNAGMPVLLQKPQLNDGHLRGMDLWRGEMQTLSGVNAVVRGESEGKSGADNALLNANAIQYQGKNVRAFEQCARSCGLGIVECLQRFADSERMVRIVGEDETPSLAYFTGQDLSEIRYVEVDMGDPITRTMQGRKAIASELLERFPQEITSSRYLAFMSSGRLEPLWKAPRNPERLIASENSALAKGETVPVLISDGHLDHIREHLALLCSPTLRADPQLTLHVLAHVQEHEMQWMQLAMRPALLAATGQPPPPPPPGMGAPMDAGAEGGPPPDANAPPGPEPKAERAEVPGGPEEVNGVPMPAMPKNASTGQPAQMGAM
jgi:hypothetical protein